MYFSLKKCNIKLLCGSVILHILLLCIGFSEYLRKYLSKWGMFFVEFQAKHIMYIVIYIVSCLKFDKEMFNKLRHVFSLNFEQNTYIVIYIFNILWCKITLDVSWSNHPLLLVKSHLLSGLVVCCFFLSSILTYGFFYHCLLFASLFALTLFHSDCSLFCVLPSSLLLAPPPTRWLRPVLEPTAAPITAAAAA